MQQLFITLASTEAAEENASIFSALGIDWRTLFLQVVAFIVLVWLLGKFVYPVLVKAIDKREAAIAESVAAASEAEAKAEKTQAEIEKLFKQARDDAASLVDTAHKESAQMVKEAEDKAKQRGQQIIKDSRAQLDLDIAKARKQLRDETTELVALATEKIIGEKVDAAKDKVLIAKSLQQSQKDAQK